MLQGKTIIVTGAGSGIGRASALMFAAAGANIIASDINVEGGQQTVEYIRDKAGQAEFFRADVSVEADVKALVEFAVRQYGRLDGALNNAGIEPHNKPIHELSTADWSSVINVDLSGVFYCLKYEFLAMKASGGGSIVNMASALGLRAQINSAEYVAAKFGVVGLTKAAAIDGGPLGIRVNAVCPGLIMTPMAQVRALQHPAFLQALEGIKTRHVIGHFGESDDVANAAMWLLSESSTFVTGTPLTVDGGFCV